MSAGGLRRRTGLATVTMVIGANLPDVDAIKVPHHGSADPGLAAVLRTLRPDVFGTVEEFFTQSYPEGFSEIRELPNFTQRLFDRGQTLSLGFLELRRESGEEHGDVGHPAMHFVARAGVEVVGFAGGGLGALIAWAGVPLLVRAAPDAVAPGAAAAHPPPGSAPRPATRCGP